MNVGGIHTDIMFDVCGRGGGGIKSRTIAAIQRRWLLLRILEMMMLLMIYGRGYTNGRRGYLDTLLLILMLSLIGAIRIGKLLLLLMHIGIQLIAMCCRTGTETGGQCGLRRWQAW